MPEGEAGCAGDGTGGRIKKGYRGLRLNADGVICCRYRREQLGLADTQLTLAETRIEMCGHVTDQRHVADRQHQGQNDNFYPYRLDHGFILV